jgi:hypothetical protein
LITESKFELRLAKKLADAGIQFELNPTIGGLRPDFVVRNSDGSRTLVEAKSWRKPSAQAVRIAIKQAQYYQMAAKADEFCVVIEGLRRSRPSEGVFTEDDLVERLRPGMDRSDTKEKPLTVGKELLQQQVRVHYRKGKHRRERTIFASMPFKEKYVDTYFNAIVPAAATVHALPDRADYDEQAGDIIQHIHRQIADCIAVVADLSEARPNVLYEIGYAKAIGKKVVQISSSPLSRLPLSVRNNNTISYAIGNTHRLKRRLRARLKKVVSD